jgi:hypothetical protein
LLFAIFVSPTFSSHAFRFNNLPPSSPTSPILLKHFPTATHTTLVLASSLDSYGPSTPAEGSLLSRLDFCSSVNNRMAPYFGNQRYDSAYTQLVYKCCQLEEQLAREMHNRGLVPRLPKQVFKARTSSVDYGTPNLSDHQGHVATSRSGRTSMPTSVTTSPPPTLFQ